MKMVDHIWAPSATNGKEATEMYKLGRPCDVMYNGTDIVDNCSQETLDQLRQHVKEQYDIDYEKDNIMLFVGRLVPVKNLDIALDAMPAIIANNPNNKLLIVGDGDYKHHLEQRCQQLGISDNVKFTGAIRDRNIITAYYKLAHLFLFPSTFDTGSLTIREAAALSLPVLVVSNCSSSEEIIDNVNGYSADNNADSWATKIIDIFSDKERHALVKQTFYNQLYRSWDMVVNQVLDKYKQIIEQHKQNN